ncbi:unnamed protein product [Larinioides sclopetarius]|uniref:Cuticle protein 16.8 n=1 Tax=Larinioides sclopetarius TaxID=280406 RepID=A0AAV2ADW6_9ARAC
MIYQTFVLAVLAVVAFSELHHVADHHVPQPYKFGYSVKDKHGEQHREEVGDGKNVKGSYGFTDARGIHRQVNYVADHAGYRAQVKTNEPGTDNQNPSDVQIISDAPNGQGSYNGATGLEYGAAGLGDGYSGIGEARLGNGYSGVGAAGLGNGYAGIEGAGLGYAGMGNGVAGGSGLENVYAASAGSRGNNLGNELFSGLGYARYGY